ncbi:MAG: DUF1232 domain-containing protein [Moorea sp. SIO2B7]|nr:DUF1232 domain-containing protein [Moorena sp. SIO2B7]
MSISPKSIYNWYRNTIRNPQYRWWIILGTLVYLISPIDISPDMFPIVGQIDDIMILTLLITEVSQLVLDFAKSRKQNINPPTEEGSGETVDVEAVSLD